MPFSHVVAVAGPPAPAGSAGAWWPPPASPRSSGATGNPEGLPPPALRAAQGLPGGSLLHQPRSDVFAVDEHPRDEVLQLGSAVDAHPYLSLEKDGIRCAAFALPDGPALQSRGGHNRARDFPTIASAVAGLPTGTVLDGELCAWNITEARFEFEALLGSRDRREANEDIAPSHVTFGLLAAPHGLRELPLRPRWDMLQAVLVDTGPPLEVAMATTARAQALERRDALVVRGVEGLVCRGWAPGTGRTTVARG